MTFTADAGQLITHVGVSMGEMDSDWIAFDNFTYRIVDPTTTVPEPSTWSLLGAGMIVLGFAARRRKVRIIV
jgi:hypothetical protein